MMHMAAGLVFDLAVVEQTEVVVRMIAALVVDSFAELEKIVVDFVRMVVAN